MAFHVVQPGENLTSIARDHGMSSWRELYNHPRNADFRRRRPNPNLIHPGDRLFVPDPGMSVLPSPAHPAPQPTFHGTAIWHDTRLAGQPDPGAADRVVTCDGSTSLSISISRIGNVANQLGGLRELDIMCHGLMKLHASGGATVPIGGGGLQLCREGLKLTTVSSMAALEGWVELIKVYACAASETHPDLVGTNYDGQRLFGEMAIHTGATVLAADVTQWYFRRHAAVPLSSTDIIDFSRWEGRVWRFDPDGSPPRVIASFPNR